MEEREIDINPSSDEESSDDEDGRMTLPEVRKERERNLSIAREGKLSNMHTFLDTSNYPLYTSNGGYPNVVNRLREKMLEQREVVKRLGKGSERENISNLQRAINLGKDVRKAHKKAIGTHEFSRNDGKKVNFNIGEKGTSNTVGLMKRVRTIDNPVSGETLDLSIDAGGYHKNPVGIQSEPRSHSAYHKGGGKTRRRRYKRKTTRKTKRHRKSKRGRKGKRSKSRRRTKRC